MIVCLIIFETIWEKRVLVLAGMYFYNRLEAESAKKKYFLQTVFY